MWLCTFASRTILAYRIYFARRGDILVILRCGGDKGSQARDIARAKAMAEQLED